MLRSAGKVANVAKRDKAWKHCPARENMELMIRAGKRAEVKPLLVSPLLLIGRKLNMFAQVSKITM